MIVLQWAGEEFEVWSIFSSPQMFYFLNFCIIQYEYRRKVTIDIGTNKGKSGEHFKYGFECVLHIQ